ncbi:MAG: hypothetical protein KGY66_00895 [Candidatus Thermoplasmatota archaeon]|nr:hypothetical protein [Candidatus Thermoplasmatota archaeon]
MQQQQIKIEDIGGNILDDLEGLCVPEEKIDDPYFVEGNFLWKRWMLKNIKKYGSVGKVAYLDSKIVGMIQYIPKTEQKIVEIKCTFVKKEKKDMNIRESLLKETIKEFEQPKQYFENERARALITLTHPFPRPIDNAEIYKENGFKQLSKTHKYHEYLLYYPLNEDYTAYDSLIESTDLPIDELDKNKALILCNSHCPYCIEEMMETFNELRKLDSNIPIKLIVPFEEPEEFTSIFSMPLCVVINGKSIGFSLLDNEEFIESMRKTLKSTGDLVDQKIKAN